jgi:hypothetical protein
MTAKVTPVPSAEGLRRYQRLAEQLPSLLHELCAAPAFRYGDGTLIPDTPGFYLFSERGIALYVGQTRNLRRRLRQHSHPNARSNDASFAFNIARVGHNTAAIAVKVTRQALEADSAFASLFTDARKRVAAMEVRYIPIPDDDWELSTVFEVYAAMALGTSRYNSFRPH